MRGGSFAPRLAAAALAVLAVSSGATAATVPASAWAKATRESRPWTRWWWLGSAVDEANLTRQLEQLAEAGFGGVEICPIYGAVGWEDRYVPFLSPRWTELLAHTTREAQRLGLGVDVTTGTGWPFGGPWVGDADASSTLVLEKDERGLTTASSRGPIQKVKRAAPGGEGNVLDPYSVPALERYLGRFDTALAGFSGVLPRAWFHDSFEYYGASFTPSLWTEFEARRGYDLRTQLPALAGEGPEDQVARVRSDYRETLSDLHLEYVRRWTGWAHAGGGLSRNQAHGAPGDLLDLYAAVDVPETEVFRQPDESQMPRLKLASSAAHVAGRNLASAEAFTWLGEHFQTSLAQSKEAADWLLLSGVNHLVYHGVPYSPAGVPWPGWQFYASVNLGPEGGLWRDLPELNHYVARVQAVLQAGEPDEDVLLFYSPRDAWHAGGELFLPNPVPPAFEETGLLLWRRGFGWDAVSERRLAEARVEDGRLRLGSGRYRALVVPRVRLMTPAAARRLAALAREGATVLLVGGPPADVPGWNALDARRAELREALRSLGLDPGSASTGATVGKGRVLVGDDVESLLVQAGVAREAMADAGVRFVRRLHPGGADYFLVNRGTAKVDGWQKLGTSARSAVLLDPLSPESTFAATLRPGAASRERGVPAARSRRIAGPAHLDVGPRFGQPVVACRGRGRPGAARGLVAARLRRRRPRASRVLRAARARVVDDARRPCGPALRWHRPLHVALRAPGRRRRRLAPRPGPGGGDGAGEAERSRPGRRLEPAVSPARRRMAPAGPNTLEIDVTNLAANRVRDLDRRGAAWKTFHDANVVNIDYKPLDASSWPLRDSGLLGPVTLQRLRVSSPLPKGEPR